MKLIKLKRLPSTKHYFNLELGYKTFWNGYKERKVVIDKEFTTIMTWCDTGDYVSNKFYDVIISFIESGEDELFV